MYFQLERRRSVRAGRVPGAPGGCAPVSGRGTPAPLGLGNDRRASPRRRPGSRRGDGEPVACAGVERLLHLVGHLAPVPTKRAGPAGDRPAATAVPGPRASTDGTTGVLANVSAPAHGYRPPASMSSTATGIVAVRRLRGDVVHQLEAAGRVGVPSGPARPSSGGGMASRSCACRPGLAPTTAKAMQGSKALMSGRGDLADRAAAMRACCMPLRCDRATSMSRSPVQMTSTHRGTRKLLARPRSPPALEASVAGLLATRRTGRRAPRTCENPLENPCSSARDTGVGVAEAAVTRRRSMEHELNCKRRVRRRPSRLRGAPKARTGGAWRAREACTFRVPGVCRA